MWNIILENMNENKSYAYNSVKVIKIGVLQSKATGISDINVYAF